MNKKVLKYDENKWEEKIPKVTNTLQMFITNRCNLRCEGCFVNYRLGSQDMSFEQYRKYILEYYDYFQKVILLGGEPTLHNSLLDMINLNEEAGKKTTIYTNGINLKRLDREDWYDTEVRVGVYGAYKSEKPLVKVPEVERPLTIVYMLRRDNIDELDIVAQMAEDRCNKFFISSIRDTTVTNDFWLDTPGTIPNDEYADIVQSFMDRYNGKIKEIHISKRGTLESKINAENVDCCRFGNIFPNDDKIICPFDIASKITTDKLEFATRKCNKKGCILQKIILKRK